MTTKPLLGSPEAAPAVVAGERPARRSGRRDFLIKAVKENAPMVAAIIAAIVLWELYVDLFHVRSFLLPAPSVIAQTAVARFEFLQVDCWETAKIVIGGFALAAVAGILLAVVALYSGPLERILLPFLVSSQVVPKVALAPLFAVWFGFGNTSKLTMVVIMAFFPIVLDTLLGLRSVRREYLLVSRSMGASRLSELVKVRFPSALPQIFAGLKMGITLAVVGAIVAEFVASDYGLGHALVVARSDMNTALVFAVLVWLMALGLVLYGLVCLAERLFLGRRASRMMEGGGM